MIGAGENGELTARALRERGVETMFVANRRYDRAIGLAQRFGGRAVRFDDLPRRADAGGHRGQLHRRRRTRSWARDELELVMELRERPAAAADRHRRAARHRPGGARAAGHHALRHGRPPARGRAQPGRAARPRRRARARSSSRRWSASATGSRASTWCPPSRRCAGAARRSSSAVLRENEGRWESLGDADRERVEMLARAVVSRLLHEPTAAHQGARPSAAAPTSTCRRCASCSA